MYGCYVRTDMGPTNTISLTLCKATKTASIIDSRVATNYPSDILNHWGGIINTEFERKNTDLQPLTNASNITQVITALKHIGTAFSSLQHDNIGLNRNLQNLIKLADMDRRVSEVERRENADLRGEVSALIVSNWELEKKLGRISDWMRMPSSPIYSGNISHKSLSESRVTVMAQPEEVSQHTEAAQPT